MLAALSGGLRRVSDWRSILLVLLLYNIFLMQVMAPHAEEMSSFAGDWGAPDGHLFYTPDKLYSELATWGDAGRQHYVDFRLGLDPVWALLYTAFLVTTISVAMRRIYPPESRMQLTNLLPLIPMLADLAENFMGIALVSAFPARMDWLAWIAATTSSIKWVTLTVGHLVMLVAISAAIWIALRARFMPD